MWFIVPCHGWIGEWVDGWHSRAGGRLSPYRPDLPSRSWGVAGGAMELHTIAPSQVRCSRRRVCFPSLTGRGLYYGSYLYRLKCNYHVSLSSSRRTEHSSSSPPRPLPKHQPSTESCRWALDVPSSLSDDCGRATSSPFPSDLHASTPAPPGTAGEWRRRGVQERRTEQ